MIGLGAIKGLNAKNLINAGIVRNEKNGNSVRISYEDPFYSVIGRINGQRFWYDFNTFKDAKAKFNSLNRQL